MQGSNQQSSSPRYERERTLFATTLQKQTTIQMVNMWQAARKGLKPIELATKKEKKLKTKIR